MQSLTKDRTRSYTFGPFALDAAERILRRDDEVIELKGKVFDLLLLLVENSGHVLEKTELMKQLWPDSFVEESNLAVNIFALRKALGESRVRRVYIETVPRRGYRFVADVTDVKKQVATSIVDPAQIDERTIAVLPFKLIRSTADDEYLGFGIADALITRLTNLRQIKVRPTSAVRKYGSGEHDSAGAGKELQVWSVLDGTIRRSGKRLRVTVQLVNVSDGATVWAQSFDEKFTNIFAVEDSISEHVANALMLKLTDRERRQLTKRYTENTEAYAAYLKGRFFLKKRTLDHLDRSFVYFKEAIRIDPDYALAYAGVADYYEMLTNYNLISPREAAVNIKEAILKALELDEALPEAHVSLGFLKLTPEWDWAGSEREFKRAIELSPAHADARRWYSIFLRLMGRFDEALSQIKTAHDLDPLSPGINVTIGSLLYFTRDYDQAIAQLSRTAELDPEFVVVHMYLGVAYEQMGLYDKAIESFQKVMALNPKVPEPYAYLGRAYALSGKRDLAQSVIGKLEQLAKEHFVSPYDRALVHLGLGEQEQALTWLERGYEERCMDLAMLKVDQRFDCLRDDPRFEKLMERMNFPE